MTQRLELRQGQAQTLTMTPQLQQAIKLLQLSNLELSAYIEAELEKNPLLERDDSAAADNALDDERHADAHERGRDTQSDRERDDAVIRHNETDNDFEREFVSEDDRSAPRETASDMGDFDAGSRMADMGRGGSASFEGDDYGFENTLTEQKSLRDHLFEQLKVDITDPAEASIGGILIDHVDETGYLRLDLDELAARLGVARARIDAVLGRMQHFDPTGIFARDLAECLSLQLREKNRLDPAMQTLVNNLPLLAMHDLPKLRKLCGVNDEDLSDMIGEIKALNPRPAAHFSHFVSQTAVPDVLMKKLPKEQGGGWGVELNADTLPRVLVNQRYYTTVLQTVRGKDDKDYLSQQMTAANWLVRALDQRAQTILKVAAEIIKLQEAFFLYGVEYLRPLVLKDVADAIGMHESTVSRVTTGKFIGTPRGLFELKFFFGSGVGSSDGAAEFAASAIKARIKTAINAETEDNVLSDDDIVGLLKTEGIDIARRTVAKYRESLNIPSSVQRRRQLRQK